MVPDARPPRSVGAASHRRGGGGHREGQAEPVGHEEDDKRPVGGTGAGGGAEAGQTHRAGEEAGEHDRRRPRRAITRPAAVEPTAAMAIWGRTANPGDECAQVVDLLGVKGEDEQLAVVHRSAKKGALDGRLVGRVRAQSQLIGASERCGGGLS